jgi:hypothetical protein
MHCSRPFFFALTIAVLAVTTVSHAEPILKARKYHGPIPRRSFGLSIGFLSGANNDAMNDYLASLIPQALENDLVVEEFGPGPTVDLYYTVKVHPQFAFRADAGGTWLSSTMRGLAVGAVPDTSGILPLLEFQTTFDIMLFSLAASGLYYFQDASVAEFQAYIGGGLTLFIPWANYELSATDADTGLPYSRDEVDHTSIEPGVHGVIGALYHIRNNVSLFTEGRYQIGQSKFRIDLPTETAGTQNLSFDVDYTGFVLTVGASRFF